MGSGVYDLQKVGCKGSKFLLTALDNQRIYLPLEAKRILLIEIYIYIHI